MFPSQELQQLASAEHSHTRSHLAQDPQQLGVWNTQHSPMGLKSHYFIYTLQYWKGLHWFLKPGWDLTEEAASSGGSKRGSAGRGGAKPGWLVPKQGLKRRKEQFGTVTFKGWQRHVTAGKSMEQEPRTTLSTQP